MTVGMFSKMTIHDILTRPFSEKYKILKKSQ